MRQSSIPLVRVGVYTPFVLAAQHIGFPAQRLLRRARLPVDVTSVDPAMAVSARLAWRFVESLARLEEGALLGVHATRRLPVPRIPLMNALLRSSLTLKALLERFVQHAPLLESHAAFSVQERGDWVHFSSQSPRYFPDAAAVETFEVMALIQLVQIATGPHWRPTVIQFTCRQREEITRAAEFTSSRILFSQPALGIVFPRRLLALPVHFDGIGKEPEIVPSELRFPEGFGEQIELALLASLSSTRPERGLAEAITGMRFRTLQRHLARAGTSWTQLLDRARFIKASQLLKTENMPIAEVARQVGYGHISTFSKAFRQLAGISPSEYRKLPG